jgi:hypothetical protein
MRFAVALIADPARVHAECVREVAEAVHYGLVALGHDSVLTNHLGLDDRRTIVLQPHFLSYYTLKPPKDPILYNFEQSYINPYWMKPELLALFRRYPVWDYSRTNIERLVARAHVPRPVHVPIGYVPELTRIVPGREDIDVLFYGAMTDRRRAILDQLRARGFRVQVLLGLYGAARDAWIARSKVVINIHALDQTNVFELVRVSYLLANRRAVVSERGSDSTEELDLESGIAFAEYDELVDRCVQLLSDECARHDLAERGYQVFSARSQAAILRRALSVSEML